MGENGVYSQNTHQKQPKMVSIGTAYTKNKENWCVCGFSLF